MSVRQAKTQPGAATVLSAPAQPPARAAAPEVASALAKRLNALGRLMLDTLVEEVPIYRRLPREQLEGEVLDVCIHNLRAFTVALGEGRLPLDDDLAAIRASAARRAGEQIPLDAVMAAYHVGGRVGWEAIVEEAHGQPEVLGAAATWLLDYLRVVTSTVAGAYLDERIDIAGEERDARRALVEALLSGAPPEPVAARAGVDLATAYVVLALRVPPTADEQDASVDPGVAGRRKVRRLELRLSEVFGANTLVLVNPSGGWVLVPGGRELLDDRESLHGRIEAAAGAGVIAGAGWRPSLAGAAEAAAEADDICRLVIEMGHPPGTYRLEDVVLDYLLTRPSRASTCLESVLAPLADGPDLITTLEAYFDADFDRRRTAAVLHVHPNTLDYRLRRVAQLTGLDPSTAPGLQLLGAALRVHRRGGASRS